MSESTLEISSVSDLEKIIIKNEIHSDIKVTGKSIKKLNKIIIQGEKYINGK